MTVFEACKLVEQLKKENESNTEEERQFNNQWLKLIYKSWGDSIDKTYKKGNKKKSTNKTNT